MTTAERSARYYRSEKGQAQQARFKAKWGPGNKWFREHPDQKKEYDRRYWLKRKYKMTPEQWDDLVVLSGGGCYLCGTVTDLVVDHNHATGRVRGILCRTCNSGLGQFKEDQKLMQKAIEYLREDGVPSG